MKRNKSLNKDFSLKNDRPNVIPFYHKIRKKLKEMEICTHV